jgi:hypothetical protein
VGEFDKLSRHFPASTEVNHDIPQSRQVGDPFSSEVLPVAVMDETVAYKHLLPKLGKDRVAT